MATHKEWQERWAKRFFKDTTAIIEGFRADVAELQEDISNTQDEAEKKSLSELIEYTQTLIDETVTMYRERQALAKRRWAIELPDLDLGTTQANG